LDVCCFRDDAMAQFFDHLGDHHSDQCFVFDQKYI
jgi:hypothetical protein